VTTSGVADLPAHLIVDAWPVMEWAQGKEPAASEFSALIEAAEKGEIQLSMSRINHGEVVYLIRKSFSAARAVEFLDPFHNLPIHLLSVPDRLIDAAVELKSQFPISFADAFAAAQAIVLTVPLLTGDRDLLLLRNAGLLRLHWIGA
jgi:predicted nucleic acid-binding protein